LIKITKISFEVSTIVDFGSKEIQLTENPWLIKSQQGNFSLFNLLSNQSGKCLKGKGTIILYIESILLETRFIHHKYAFRNTLHSFFAF
jgi:hypothetical protein